MFNFNRSLFAATLAALLAGPAMAATVTEGDLGDFSGNYSTPTVIANGATQVDGVWSGGNDYDLLAFTGLKAGAQTITLTFAPLAPIGDTDWSFSAGGTVLWKTSQFLYSAWEGNWLASVGIQHWNRNNDFSWTINLGDDFGGSLYLALLNTYGTLKYSIFAPGNAATSVTPTDPVVTPSEPVPAAVPLPAAAPLLLAGLGALGALGAARRRKAA